MAHYERHLGCAGLPRVMGPGHQRVGWPARGELDRVVVEVEQAAALMDMAFRCKGLYDKAVTLSRLWYGPFAVAWDLSG